MSDIIIPISRIEKYLAQIAENTAGGGGGGSSVTVEALTATENKTYTAPEGKAYSPVTVNVPTGGGGLEYEEGIYTPASDIARPTISFVNTHSTTPIAILIMDATGTAGPVSSVIYWVFANWYDVFGATKGGDGGDVYGGLRWAYATSGGFTANGTNVLYLDSSGDQRHMGYNASPSEFYPYAGINDYKFRTGRTYKWIAVWAPES